MIKFFKKTSACLAAAFTLITAAPSLTALAVDGYWPCEQKYTVITTAFDPNRNTSDVSGYHNGIDIQADGNTKIYAAYPGKVITADWMDAYGYMVIIQHSDLGIYTFYAHCSALNVNPGDTVKAGDVIGFVGSTGQSYGYHLHFGICSKLNNGWPAALYYDPQTYFTYTDKPVNPPTQTDPKDPPTTTDPPEKNDPKTYECGCSDEYAGTYTTKGVTTYLNIRSGHSTDSAIVGKINPGDTVIVTMSNGKWAHVECNGVKGFASMDYLQKKPEVKSGMTISGGTTPTGSLPVGAAFSVRGIITSNLPIKKVWGGVYTRDGKPTAQIASATPNTTTYNLNSYLDERIVFNALPVGYYIFKIEAEDTNGKSFVIEKSEFTVGNPSYVPPEYISGDLDDDASVAVSDLVVMRNYLLGTATFSEKQSKAADLNNDKTVDSFDMAALRKMIISNK